MVTFKNYLRSITQLLQYVNFVVIIIIRRVFFIAIKSFIAKIIASTYEYKTTVTVCLKLDNFPRMSGTQNDESEYPAAATVVASDLGLRFSM